MTDARGTLSFDGGGVAISAGRFFESPEGSGGLPMVTGMLSGGVKYGFWHILLSSEERVELRIDVE
jgi:hypothetical protein